MKIEELILVGILDSEGWEKNPNAYLQYQRWKYSHMILTITDKDVYISHESFLCRESFASKIKWGWSAVKGTNLPTDNFYKQLCDLYKAKEKEEEHDT